MAKDGTKCITERLLQEIRNKVNGIIHIVMVEIIKASRIRGEVQKT